MYTGNQNCVSREEFESQINSLQRELYYWQNTTINILKKYLVDNEGEQQSYIGICVYM